MSEINWDEANALLSKLERRVTALESRKGPSENRPSIPASMEAVVEENTELKAKIKKLEYRILMLCRALKESDAAIQ